MNTVLATFVALLTLSAAGLVPVAAAVGLRWCAIPLAPLGGAVLAAVAGTASLSFGGPLIDWFAGMAVVAALVVFVVWVQRPELGPWGQSSPWDQSSSRVQPGPRSRATRRRHLGRVRHRAVGALGFVAVVASCAICLRGLRTPSVGFDARALWVMRPGWFLQSHAQLLVDMRARGLVLTQSAYPPLISASTAIAWRVSGLHTARVGVTTIAMLNMCALAAAALALVDGGRTAAARVAGAGLLERGTDPAPGGADPPARPPWAPMLTGVIAAVLLVFVAAGVTEPFLTNGYADPLWSLAAVGAVAFGLQSHTDRSTRAATVVLLLVAGLTKDEGFVTAIALVALVAARSIGWEGLRRGSRRWAGPVVLALTELAVLAWWPLLMHAIGARGASSTFTTSNGTTARATAVVHGMSPYLHVLVLALPLAIVGGLALTAVRRRAGLGNDLWAWLALAVGLVAVGGALVTGSGAILPWIRSTVHRITEYPILEAWWIIAVWAVAASSGVGRRAMSPASEPSDDRRELVDRDRAAAPVGASS